MSNPRRGRWSRIGPTLMAAAGAALLMTAACSGPGADGTAHRPSRRRPPAPHRRALLLGRAADLRARRPDRRDRPGRHDHPQPPRPARSPCGRRPRPRRQRRGQRHRPVHHRAGRLLPGRRRHRNQRSGRCRPSGRAGHPARADGMSADNAEALTAATVRCRHPPTGRRHRRLLPVRRRHRRQRRAPGPTSRSTGSPSPICRPSRPVPIRSPSPPTNGGTPTRTGRRTPNP